MNIESFASFYVSTLEPALKFIAFFVFVVFLLQMLNFVRDGKKKSDLVGSAFNFIINVVKGFFIYSGRFMLWLVKFSAKIITVIYAAIRDFFTSKI